MTDQPTRIAESTAFLARLITKPVHSQKRLGQEVNFEVPPGLNAAEISQHINTVFAHSEASVGNSFRYGYPSHPGLDTVYLPVHFSDAARDKLNEIVDAAKAQGRVLP